MDSEREWFVARRGDQVDIKSAGMGLLRFSLLFGVCALALSVVAAPALQRKSEDWLSAGRTDPMSVAATPRADVYTIRKSVLQQGPNSVCIIRPNGTQSGDC